MPEAYTHLRCAQGGAALARIRPQDPEAFAAGANGPDIFFCYRCWLPAARRGQNLPALGSWLHRHNTGAFLLALLDHARTPVQQSYALGFLTHYAVDRVLHPYVGAISGPQGPYHRPGGHGYFEGALDSALHRHDTGDGAVPVRDSLPRLTGSRLAEVGVLLQQALQEACGVQVTREALADTFHHSWYWRRMFVSRLRIKRGFFWLVEPLFGGRSHITGHMTPAHLRCKELPAQWTDPATGLWKHADLEQLLGEAQRRSAAYLEVGVGYWQGKLDRSQLKRILGSASYDTDTEDGDSTGNQSFVFELTQDWE